MRMRTRKLLGTVLMILLVIVWSLGAMMFAQGRVALLPAWGQLICYVVLGMGWIIPAGALIKWMQRPDPQTD